MKKKGGWFGESRRHSLASKGVRTAYKKTKAPKISVKRTLNVRKHPKNLYRVRFAPDGERWIDNKKNDTRSLNDAIYEAKDFASLVPMGKVEVIDMNTGEVLYKN